MRVCMLHFFENSQFTCRGQGDTQNFFARNLRERIEVAQGFKFVAEEFEPHRPRAGERPDIENAAAQGDFTLLRDLGFRFAAALFKPFDQVERTDFIAAGEPARVVFQVIRREGLLPEARTRQVLKEPERTEIEALGADLEGEAIDDVAEGEFE